MMHPGTERPDQNRYYWIRFARDGIWAIGWWLDRFWRCPVTQERLGDVYEWADILMPEQEEEEQYRSEYGRDRRMLRELIGRVERLESVAEQYGRRIEKLEAEVGQADVLGSPSCPLGTRPTDGLEGEP